MSRSVDQRLTNTTVCRGEPAVEQSPLNVVVIHTSYDGTVAALKHAVSLAESLGAQITLISSQVVPYPLPLTQPPVPIDFQEKRLSEIAAESSVDIRVQLYFCRNELQTLQKVLRA